MPNMCLWRHRGRQVVDKNPDGEDSRLGHRSDYQPSRAYTSSHLPSMSDISESVTSKEKSTYSDVHYVNNSSQRFIQGGHKSVPGGATLTPPRRLTSVLFGWSSITRPNLYASSQWWNVVLGNTSIKVL
jgi:hypothetical protein